MSITYTVEKNKKYGDYRVQQTVNGEWENEFDSNWTKAQAEKIAQRLHDSSGLEFFRVDI